MGRTAHLTGRSAVAAVATGALAAAALAGAVPARAATAWLCKPGLRANPCAGSLDTTVFTPAGRKLRVERVRAARRPTVDCFYVYPTTSEQKTPQATLRADPELRSIALYQAARYARDCRVFAPLYRQITIQGLLNPSTVTQAMRTSALADVRAAWREYLSRDNHGRGVVLIGHSQGTFMLRQLIARDVDPEPAVRRRLVSALLLGGDVTVRRGHDVGGDFRHVPACRSARQLGCVVAFSTFNEPVPATSLFGRTTQPGLEVLCTNPAALGGGSGTLTPIYPRAPFAPGTIGTLTRALGSPTPSARTAWLAFPNSYRAQCVRGGGANVLQVTSLGGAPKLRPVPNDGWGLHIPEANLALGNLTALVRSEIARYVATRGSR